MFARQPGILLTLSALANAVAWEPVGTLIACWSSNVLVKLGLHVLGVLILFLALFGVNLLLILTRGRTELDDRVVRHWEERILAHLDGRAACHVYKDNLDRTAQLCVLVHRLSYKAKMWNWK